MPSKRRGDLVALQEWIASCCRMYSQATNGETDTSRIGPLLSSLKHAVDGVDTSDGAERIRELLAIGAFHYQLGESRPDPRAQYVPRTIAIGLATEMLWAIVIADLPSGWVPALASITDLPIVEAVAEVRASEGDRLELTRRIAQPRCAPGLRRAFEDLSDPMRGGCYVIALGRSYRPSSRVAPIEWLIPSAKWVGLAATAGVIGNRADALLLDALVDALKPQLDHATKIVADFFNSARDSPVERPVSAGSPPPGDVPPWQRGAGRTTQPTHAGYTPPLDGPGAGVSAGNTAGTDTRPKERSSQEDQSRTPPPRAAVPTQRAGSTGTWDNSYAPNATDRRDTPGPSPIAGLGYTASQDGGYSGSGRSFDAGHHSAASSTVVHSGGQSGGSGTFMDMLWIMSHDMIHFVQSLMSLH